MRVWKFKTMLPMKIYENLCAFVDNGAAETVNESFRMRNGEEVNVCDNKFTECDEFQSVDDEFLLRFIIVNLHICFYTIIEMKIPFSIFVSLSLAL